jgi:uncharacterized membrane protein YdjX (TVP38/TMEM64 family)
MRRLAIAACVLAALFCIAFLVTDALEVELLRDPTPWLRAGGVLPAAIGVALLVADVVLPVPSSVVMMALGAARGVVVGAALSLLGALGSAWLGLLLGRRGGAWLVGATRGGERSARLLARWGPLAIAVTRPIPVIAETTAILAGASGVSWSRATLATIAGAAPPALIYAWAGARAAEPRRGAAIAAGIIVGAGVLWWAGHRWSSTDPHPTGTPVDRE